MKVVKAIPNILTLANLSLGVLGIQVALDGDIQLASWFILIAVSLDFLDGFTARILKAQSPIGQQLDSLADLVSFGVLPGFIYCRHLGNLGLDLAPSKFGLLFLIVPILSALRLAKFNVDENQTDEFIGLSTTAHAIFVSSIVLFASSNSAFNGLFLGYEVWLILMFLGSFLLVSPIRLIALKFKTFNLKENWTKYILLALGVIFVAIFRIGGLSLTIISYIILSMIYNLSRNKN